MRVRVRPATGTLTLCCFLDAQELVCDFIGGVAVAASQHAQQRTGTPKLSTEDVIGVVRKDAARLARAKELVTANEETRKALRVVQTDEKDLAELGK